MGAVKEQSANLYATKMALQGFVAMAIDLPFGARAKDSLAMALHRTSLPKGSALRSISWVRARLSTESGSAAAAAAASSSALPRSTRA
jgi:hypothetical protein